MPVESCDCNCAWRRAAALRKHAFGRVSYRLGASLEGIWSALGEVEGFCIIFCQTESCCPLSSSSVLFSHTCIVGAAHVRTLSALKAIPAAKFVLATSSLSPRGAWHRLKNPLLSPATSHRHNIKLSDLSFMTWNLPVAQECSNLCVCVLTVTVRNDYFPIEVINLPLIFLVHKPF